MRTCNFILFYLVVFNYKSYMNIFIYNSCFFKFILNIYVLSKKSKQFKTINYVIHKYLKNQINTRFLKLIHIFGKIDEEKSILDL